MAKLLEKNLDAEIDKLAGQFTDMVSKEPHTMMERFMSIAMGQPTDRLPVFLQIHDYAAKVAGVTVKEICTDPKKMLYAQLFAALKFKYEQVAPMADIYNYEAEALGAKMLFPEDSFPVILEPLIKEESDLEKLEIPDFTKAGRCPLVMEANRLSMEKLGKYAMPFCIASGPWSVAVSIRGFNNLIRDTRKNPEFAHKVLDFSVNVVDAYSKTQQKALGIPASPMLADAYACIPPTSPKLVYDYVIPHTADLIKKLGPTVWGGGFPVMECPNYLQIYEDDVVKTGSLMGMIMMLESDWLPPEEIKALANRVHRAWIFGVRAGMISKSTPKEIENYTKKLIKILCTDGGFIIMGDQIPRDTPSENLSAFVNTIKTYGKYPISI